MKRWKGNGLAFLSATVVVGLGAAPLSAQDAVEFDFPIQTMSIGGTSADPAQRIPPPRRFVNVEPQTVPLEGAGWLTFEPDPSAIGLSDWNGAQAAEARVRMFFDAAGRPAECNVLTTSAGWAGSEPNDWNRSGFVDGICQEFTAKAQFRRNDWFEMPMASGFIERRILLTRSMTPELPVRLTNRETGLGVEISLYRDDDGLRCRADRRRVLPHHGEAICEAVIEHVLSTVDPADRDWSGGDRIAYVAGTLDSTGRAQVRGDRFPAYAMGAVWPAADIPEAQLLGPDEASLSGQLYYDDLRIVGNYEFTASVQVLLGVSDSGEIKTCRPVGRNSYVRIDLATCASLVRRTRLELTGSPVWDGLRYRLLNIVWRSPED